MFFTDTVSLEVAAVIALFSVMAALDRNETSCSRHTAAIFIASSKCARSHHDLTWCTTSLLGT